MPTVEVAENRRDTLVERQTTCAADIATFFKAAGDPLRLRVIRLLKEDSMDVSELCELLEVRQPALSHHLKVLTSCGLLRGDRDGNHIYYRRAEQAGSDAREALYTAVLAAADSLDLGTSESQRLEALHSKRQKNSLSFFKQNLPRFREQQDLIAAPSRYAEVVNEHIRSIPADQRSRVLEIGPGDGWLLPTLSAAFTSVYALDNSKLMLDAARKTSSDASLNNVNFVHGDTADEIVSEPLFDLVVVNMVLHHTPDPQNVLLQAAHSLVRDGFLLVTELCEHNQGWARDNCGDLWLGFKPELVATWASKAGLAERTSSYQGQRNGFTLQVRLFQKTYRTEHNESNKE
ncbi:MAG: metalloregulator ArsR/SmtB family transcription factor [Pseudomonadota bacterium]